MTQWNMMVTFTLKVIFSQEFDAILRKSHGLQYVGRNLTSQKLRFLFPSSLLSRFCCS